jgi:hypothetical protein
LPERNQCLFQKHNQLVEEVLQECKKAAQASASRVGGRTLRIKAAALALSDGGSPHECKKASR